MSAEAPELLVKRERAARQLAEEVLAGTSGAGGAGGKGKEGEAGWKPAVPGKAGETEVTPTAPGGACDAKPKVFYGNVAVDAARISRDMDAVAKEVVQHLASLPGAVVRITVEIQATVDSGVPDGTVRTVNENCRTLKFTSHGFERE